jgi:hypothetical protein
MPNVAIRDSLSIPYALPYALYREILRELIGRSVVSAVQSLGIQNLMDCLCCTGDRLHLLAMEGC